MSENQDYIRPVIPLVLAFGAGILAGEAGVVPLFPVAVVFCLGLFLVFRALYQSVPARFSPLLIFACLGVLAMHSLNWPEADSSHIVNYTGQGLLRVQGALSTAPEMNHGRQTFILDVERVQPRGETRRDSRGKIRVTFAMPEPVLGKGDRIEIGGRLKSFRNFSNPDGFDYERYMRFKGVCGRVYVKEGQLAVLERPEPSSMDSARQRVSALIDASVSSESANAVLKALLIGRRGEVPPELNEAFNKTGTAHLLAISGLHVGIVAGVAYGLLVWMLSFIPALLWKARVRAWAGLLALIPVLFYGILAGMAPSTQRAVIMVAVVLLTHGLEAEHDIINSLAWAAMIILAFSPGDLFGVSFQLSFTAVFFIVWGMGRVAERPVDEDLPPGRLKSWVTSYAWVSLFAWLGTLPLVLYYFNQLSLIGIPANMVLVPLVGFLVVPLGLFGLLVYPLSSVVAGVLIKVSGMVLELALTLSQSLASLPFSSFKTVRPTVLEILCYYGLLCLLIHLLARKETLKPKMKKAMAGAFAFLGVIVAADAAYWVHHRYFHREMRVTVLDVGQGSANLVEFPGGQCMMIDGGGFGGWSSFDVGEKVVAPFLWSKKIGRVDTVVLTHPESDHMNGLLYILEHFQVKELWFNGPWRLTQSCDHLKDTIRQKGIVLKNVEDLSGIHVMGGAQVRVLWPLSNHGGVAVDQNSFNNTSLVVRISLGDESFLFPGDIMEKAETKLVQALCGELESTVLIVPHHGSKTSSTQTFVDCVNPEIALISAGYKNWFKMPHKVVLKRYMEEGAAIYRTDLQGAILTRTSGDGICLETVLDQ